MQFKRNLPAVNSGLSSPVDCTTNSASIPFIASNGDELTAKAGAIQACEANSKTNNAECLQHASCEFLGQDPSKNGYSCLASSNSLDFFGSGQSNFAAKVSAVLACEANSNTTNSSCLSSVVCEATQTWGQWTCSTTSNSMPFTMRGQSHYGTLVQAVQACEANSSTTNSACANNVQCTRD